MPLPTPHWLLLEPYYDGSHRHLVDGLRARLLPESTLWTLPARKWKWRMRGSSLEFARRARLEDPPVDAIWASSMVNLAEFVGIAPPALRRLPRLAYFHENQLTYPVQHFDARDHHFAWTNVHTALAADRVLWNSAHNRDSFLDRLRWLLRRMPDARPDWTCEAISARSEVLPVPVDVAAIEEIAAAAPARRGPCHVVWNHRWEFDKGPDRLLALVRRLEARTDLALRFSVLGQSFRETPEAFDEIRERLGARLAHWGFLPSREDYLRVLADADVVLSTTRHEFQGLSVIEGAAAGAVPLVPDDLAYPEAWPPEWRYRDDEDLFVRLLERAGDPEHWRRVDPRPAARAFSWESLGVRWRAALDATLAGR